MNNAQTLYMRRKLLNFGDSSYPLEAAATEIRLHGCEICASKGTQSLSVDYLADQAKGG